MKYDAILLTDLEDALVPVKTTGAFKIASVLRQKGYSVKVIDNIIYIMNNHSQLLYDYIDSHKPFLWPHHANRSHDVG